MKLNHQPKFFKLFENLSEKNETVTNLMYKTKISYSYLLEMVNFYAEEEFVKFSKKGRDKFVKLSKKGLELQELIFKIKQIMS